MLKPGRAAQGFGKRVDVRARLEGDPDDPETYYCLDEIWDWGDGTESVSEPDCDPFEDGTELKTNFMDTISARAGGSSHLTIVLQRFHRDGVDVGVLVNPA